MAQPPDVVDLLLADHHVLRRLIDDLDAAERPSEMRAVYLRIVTELSAHEAAEEEVVFPALREALPAAAEEARARTGEHEEVDSLIDEMRRLPASGHGFAKRACALVLDLAAHLDAEEEDVFPVLQAVLTPEQLVELRRRALAVKERSPAFHDHISA